MFLKEALLLLAGRLSAPDWKDGDGVEGENLLV